MSQKFEQTMPEVLFYYRRHSVSDRVFKGLRGVSVAVIAAVSGLFNVSLAQGENLFLTGMSSTPAVTGNVTGVSSTIYVGGYSGLWNSDPLFAFCVDLAQTISFQTNYGNYTLVNPSSAFSGVEISDMKKLFNTHYSDAQTNSANSAAFQFALWEIVSEASGSYSLSSGTFEAVSSSSGAAVSTANLWLGELSTAFEGNVDLKFFHSPTQQDLITMSRVPGQPNIPLLVSEPSTSALMLTAIGVLGWATRRRKHDRERLPD